MQSLGSGLIVGGMLIAALAQIVGAVAVFKADALKGFLSLVVPGYFLFALSRVGIYWRIVGFWALGIVALIIGTVLLS